MSDTWAAKVLEGVPRLWLGAENSDNECEVWFDPDEGGTEYVQTDAALAAIVRMGAGDGWFDVFKNVATEAERVAAYEKTRAEASEAEAAALRERVARLEGALTDMPKAVLRTTICQGPQWPDDRPGVWLAALEACAKSVQTAVNAAIPAATRPVQDDAASRRRKIMGHMDDRAAADARAEALLKRAAQMAYEVWDDPEALAKAILALIPETKP